MKIVAHRGAWKEFGLPENSLESLNKAIEIGVEASELDVHFSKDGSWVVYHDNTLNGFVIETLNRTYIQQQALSNGSYIPTLRAVLELIQLNHFHLVCEIKVETLPTSVFTRSIEALQRLMHQFPTSLVEFICFDLQYCLKLKGAFPDRKVSYLGGDVLPQEINQLGLDGIDYEATLFVQDATLLTSAQSLRLQTNAWTVNDVATALELNRQGIDAITTDEPLAMKQLFTQKK